MGTLSIIPNLRPPISCNNISPSNKTSKNLYHGNRHQFSCKRHRISAVDEVSAVTFDPGAPDISWQIIVGSIAGVTPFVVAGIEFSKRIVLMEIVADTGGDDYPELDNLQQMDTETMHEDVETIPGTAPVRGIGLKVTNIEGNSLMPRRGMYSTSTNSASVINGLAAISKPVGFEYKGWAGTATQAIPINETPLQEGIRLEKSNKNTGKPVSSDLFKTGTMSFADKLKGERKTSKVNFRFLENNDKHGVADVTIPIESVKKVQEKCSNVLFGYFLGKRLAFPVVEYFVKNRWDKYGLQKSMMNAKGFFFFKFDSNKGMDQVLQEGPWLIRNITIFLKPWSSMSHPNRWRKHRDETKTRLIIAHNANK